MRTEQQIFDLILSFAVSHDEIRAVSMNGSRANPNAPKDIFCDYDIVYFVEDPRRFLEDQSWIPNFGELVILQQNDFIEHDLDGYIFLMQFKDGVRIDLAFDPLPYLNYLGDDSTTILLLDKDQRAAPLPPTSDADYITKRPSRKEFDEAINEVFWCSTNTAKGIWRDELTFAKVMNDTIVRDEMVVKILGWYAAMLHKWTINPGKYGKWLRKYLPAEIWNSVEKMYAGANYEETWDALFEMCRMVRKIGIELADHLGYKYPLEDDRRTLEYLQRVRALPWNARCFDQ